MEIDVIYNQSVVLEHIIEPKELGFDYFQDIRQ
jgi:hypothetical protein